MKDKVSYWTIRRRSLLTVQSWSGSIHDENVYADVDEPLLRIESPMSTHGVSCVTAAHADDTNEDEMSEYSCVAHPVVQLSRSLTKRDKTDSDDIFVYNYDEEERQDVNRFSDSEDMNACDAVENLSDQIATWAIREKVKDTAVDKLLQLLKPHHPDLPLTSRTLKNTGHQPADIVTIAGGEYVHFGLLNGMKRFETEILALSVDVIDYHINVDGLPLFRSSSTQLWPILGKIVGLQCPFMIGAFCGPSKPSNVNEFLHSFIEEATALQTQGLTLQGITFRARPVCFVCDAPARALLKQTKSHTGYYGCDRCVEKGEYIQGRVTFPQFTVDKRTDDLFADVAYEDHQLSRSPLIDLGCGMISGFVLDYMHLVCLGVVRRLLHFWLRGPLAVRLSARYVTLISQELVSMRGCVPSEFARKPRALTELEYWKASELRQFLLYTGMVVLRDHKIDKELYEHFVCLSVIMHILLSPTLFSYYNEYVEELAVFWVRKSAELYGKHFVVYNVHCLIHLVDDCRNFGSLDKISAFPYENFMQVLKSSIRKPQHILQQLSNRMCEGFFDTSTASAESRVSGVKHEHTSGPMVVGALHCKQYRQVQLTDFVIKVDGPDNCIMYGSKIGLVANVVSDGNSVSVIVQKFGSMKSFFRKPVKSSDIGIYKVSKLSKHMEMCRISLIERKYILLPYRDGRKYVAIPVNHSI